MPKYRNRDYRVSEFHHGVKGVDPITGGAEGTEVPAKQEKQVLDAAERAGRELVKVEEEKPNSES